MSTPLSIAMIGTKGIPTTFGGIERHVEELGARLVERGHRVTVYCRRNYTAESREKCEVLSPSHWRFRGMDLRLGMSLGTKHLDAISHTGIALMRHLFAKHDIVHFHAIGPSLLSWIPRLMRRKVVATCHGLDWQRRKWGGFAKTMLQAGEWSMCQWPHTKVAVSQTLRDHLQAKHDCEVTYIPNGIELPETLPANEITQRWGLRGGDYHLFLSRLVPEKRCDLLIEAFRGMDTDRKLVIAGGSSMSDDHVAKLHALAEGDERIIFTGNVTGDLFRELMSNAHVFVLPSELEGLPIVLLEALSFGRCALASDIPMNMEILRGLEGGDPIDAQPWGRSFRCNDAESLRQELQWLEQHPEEVASLGQEARGRVGRHFTWEQVTDLTEALYHRTVDGPRAG